MQVHPLDSQEQNGVVNLCSPCRPAESEQRADKAPQLGHSSKRRTKRPAAAAPLIDLSTDVSPAPGPSSSLQAKEFAVVSEQRPAQQAQAAGTEAGSSRKRRWGEIEDDATSLGAQQRSAAELQQHREQQQRLRSHVVAELERQRQEHLRQRAAQWQQATEQQHRAADAAPGRRNLQWGRTSARQQCPSSHSDALQQPSLQPHQTGQRATPQAPQQPRLQPLQALSELLGRTGVGSGRRTARAATAGGSSADARGPSGIELEGDELLAWRMQQEHDEEEDARLAAAMLEEEQESARLEQERLQASIELMQRLEEQAAAHDAEFMAALAGDDGTYQPYHSRRHGSSRRAAAGRSHRPASATSAGSGAAAAAAAAGVGGRDSGSRRGLGLAMASALMALPRFGGGAGGHGRPGLMLPRGLRDMREAMINMQRAGLPPQMLFSDRDFTADDYEMLLRLDDTVESRKGAAAEAIASLPSQVVPAGGLHGDNGERLSCAVCLEEWGEGARVCTLPCLHRFCSGCIKRWLEQKSTCPICQREFSQ